MSLLERAYGARRRVRRTASAVRSRNGSRPRERRSPRSTSRSVPDLGAVRARGALGPVARPTSLEGLIAEAEAAVGPLDVLVNNAGVYEPSLADRPDARVLPARARRQPARPGLSREQSGTRHDRARLRPHRQHHLGARPLRRGDSGSPTTSRRAAWSRRRGRWRSSFHATVCSSTRSRPGSSRPACRSSTARTSSRATGSPTSTSSTERSRSVATRMPDEIAEHVAWLGSERNTYLTGQVVTVDGGLTVTF